MDRHGGGTACTPYLLEPLKNALRPLERPKHDEGNEREMMTHPDIVTVSVAKQIAEHIRVAIMEGRYKADDRLPSESELAQSYGVSRPTIREALKRLAAQNLIRSRRGPTGGNFVTCPKPTELAQSLSSAAMLLVSMGAFDHDEIASARQTLEGACCRLAVEHRTEDHLARMEAEIAVQRSDETSDANFCASDVRFHRALVEATGNGLIGLSMHAVVEAMMPVVNLVIFRERNRHRIAGLHETLLAAIRKRDADAAETAFDVLMDNLRALYRESLAHRAR